MALFKKYRRPEELGAMLYEHLRSGMSSDGDLSLDQLLHSFDRTTESLSNQFHGEAIVGLMFASTLAIERSASSRVAAQIIAGMKVDFLNHLEEQGASTLQRAEWDAVTGGRFLEYRKCLEDYSGFEPPWKLGRTFFWNLIGEEVHMAMPIKIATLYLLSARDSCQQLLNVHGPTLISH